MGQVPSIPFRAYLLVGRGRLATHFRHYFDLESIPYFQWSREQDEASLKTLAAKASHVLLAISDSAIERFFEDHRETFRDKTCVHFSGALVSQKISSAHPLMTFAAELYSRENYRTIPFVVEKGRRPFTELLPQLKNPSFELEAENKPLYHALCVMSGNFTVLLWEKVFSEFNRLGLPRGVLTPYLNQTCLNLSGSRESVLTGPLKRNDQTTIAKHLEVLGDDPYADVYRAFLHAYGGSQ